MRTGEAIDDTFFNTIEEEDGYDHCSGSFGSSIMHYIV